MYGCLGRGSKSVKEGRERSKASVATADGVYLSVCLSGDVWKLPIEDGWGLGGRYPIGGGANVSRRERRKWQGVFCGARIESECPGV